MALLTDIVASGSGGGGTQLGDYLNARPEHLGLSGNIGSQQFVRTGFVVPYEGGRHGGLVALSKAYGVVSGNASHLLGNNWLQRTSTNQAAVRHANGRYYVIETAAVQSTWGAPSQNVAYGNTYFNGTNASAGIPSAFSGATGIGDSLEFNNGINVIGYTGGNPHGTIIFRLNSTGNAFTSVFTNGTPHGGAYGACLANSSSNVCSWPGGYVTPSSVAGELATSNDGVTWTQRSPTVNGSTSFGFDGGNINTTRLAFSSVANAYIICSTNTSHYFVSNNGYNLTLVNGPLGYSSVPWNASAPSASAYGFYANSPTVTLIPAGSGKFLRITGNPVTDPTAHSIVDVGKGGYSAAMFNVVWTGSEFVAFPYVTGGLAWCQMFTSPDGLNWTPNYTYAAVYARDSRFLPPIGQPSINQQIYTVSQANGRTFVQSTGVLDWPIYDVTGRLGANTTPDYVGVPVALSFASGSSYVPYLRVT